MFRRAMKDREQSKSSKFNLTTLSFSRWSRHLQSLARLNELDDLEEKIKECLTKAFKDENDLEFDDSSRSMSSVSRSSEVKVR